MSRKTTCTSRPQSLKSGAVPEKVIQAQILRWLQKTDLIHWRQQSGKVMLGRYRINMGPEGLPDIIVIVPPGGRVVGLEVKSAKGRVRPSQVEFQRRFKKAGGDYVIVRSLNDAKNALAKATGEEHWSSRTGLCAEDWS